MYVYMKYIFIVHLIITHLVLLQIDNDGIYKYVFYVVHIYYPHNMNRMTIHFK